MTKLSWNEIRHRAIGFARTWEGVTRERAEAQSFWNEFFEVFGIKRRLVASFEEPVKSLKNTYHSIDLFWKGRLLAEHKSAGESLDKAQSQAFQYIQELATSGRTEEIPRYVVVSNFHHVVLYDLEPDDQQQLPLWEGRSVESFEFALDDFHKQVKHFAFIIGQKTHRFAEEDPANLEAAQLMADLHDAVKAGGYKGKELERLLVRLLFCLFADDTGIFDPGQFQLYIENRTREDGTDLGMHLNTIFEILDTPEAQRPPNLDEDFAGFPYVNGELFSERLRLAAFNRDMRNRLLAAARFDWSRISPAVFGSLFQGIMDDKERRQIGAHYTSERDILKVIRPLFLDALQEEFQQIKTLRRGRAQRLKSFHEKLPKLKLLDPACGCGNFLVIAYRELRRLELEAITLLHRFDEKGKELELGELAKLSQVDVGQFYGIEIGEWAARIAETALWLTDHQMNTELSIAAGNQFMRIPLKSSPHILCANALRVKWNDLLPASECSYVLGNPPFVGKHLMTPGQKEDVGRVWNATPGSGTLDYVTCWYKVASEYINGSNEIECAFVSTNSITQGEQPGYLWSYLFARGIKIHFAHRTFPWESEARGRAHVHVVIIGFGRGPRSPKLVFDYLKDKKETHVAEAFNINPYLSEGEDLVLLPRTEPLCDVPPTMYGNKPADGGFLMLDVEKKFEIERRYPELLPLVRPMVSADEYLNGSFRYCLWMKDANLAPFHKHPYLHQILTSVRTFREASTKHQTRELATIPHLFAEIRQPDHEYIVIPRHSSEQRAYIPFGYFASDVIVHDSCTALPNATPYHFGVLSSAMHMAWVREVCGRLKSDFRYSTTLVYNNFSWPLRPTAKKREAVETRAQIVLQTRQKHMDGGASLAQIYDPLYMPANLLKAHQELDRAVDRCYRSERFGAERERVEFLFMLYKQLTSPLETNSVRRRR